MSPPDLAGKTAIVTGAGRGIGRAIALALADHGANVVCAARTRSELHALVDSIASRPGNAIAAPTDVASEQQVRTLVATAIDTYGALDIVINNAAVGRFGPLEDMRTEEWDLVMAVNVRGPFLLCRTALPYLRGRPRSWIVNIGSVVSIKGYRNQSAYSASKHALLGMTKALAREVQQENVRVHAVLPGGVDTTLVGDARPDLDRSVLIQPREVADAVLYLLSQTGNAVTDELHLRRDVSTPWG